MNEIDQFLMSHGGPLLFAVVFAEQAGLPLPARSSGPWEKRLDASRTG